MLRTVVTFLPCSVLLKNWECLLADMHIVDQECADHRAITVLSDSNDQCVHRDAHSRLPQQHPGWNNRPEQSRI